MTEIFSKDVLKALRSQRLKALVTLEQKLTLLQKGKRKKSA